MQNRGETPKLAAMTKQKRITIYTTSRCSVCAQAKKYFTQRGIAFVEFDVQRSKRGIKDFQRMRGRGVPIIMIGDQRVDGFDKQGFEAIYDT